MFIVRLSFSTKQHVCNRYNGSLNLTFEHVKFRRQFGWGSNRVKWCFLLKLDLIPYFEEVPGQSWDLTPPAVLSPRPNQEDPKMAGFLRFMEFHMFFLFYFQVDTITLKRNIWHSDGCYWGTSLCSTSWLLFK